jgi:hypothetical protein
MSSNAQIWMLAIVFLAQIIVLSFIAPARLVRAYRQMFDRYPPEQFARLYPVSIEEMQRWQRVRTTLHSSIGCAGLIVLVATLLTAERPKTFFLVIGAFMMIQLLPTLLRVAQQRRLFKEVAKMAPPAKRSAPLHAWRLTDFVSPLSIALGFIGTAVGLGTSAYLYFVGSQAKITLGFFAIVNILLLFRMLQLVFLPLKFKRPDPFMTQEDMFRRRQQNLRLLFRFAAIMGIYVTFMMLCATRTFSIDPALVVTVVSILMQAAWLRLTGLIVRTLESTDFSVYREPGALPTEAT